MNPNIFRFQDEAEFHKTALEDVSLSIKEILKKEKTCRIGLAGGSTPKTLYSALAEQNLAWDKIVVIQIDERQVPSDHPESNLKMIRDTLAKKIALRPENLLAFDTALPAESAAKDMSRKLITLSHERFPIFDLLILGAGADGHIASLFEGDAALQSSNYAAVAHAAGQKVEARLTLTILALKSADRALLLLKGAEKAPVVESIEGKGSLPLTALREVMEDVPTKILFCYNPST
jgi:6-phosphogluconolactonase